MTDLTATFQGGTLEIIREARRLGLTWGLRPATVTSTTQVRYDGDDEETLTQVTNLLEGPLYVDQRVMCAFVPPSGNFVIGMLGGGRGLAAESYRDTTVGSILTTETVVQYATFQSLPGITYEVTAVQNYQSTAANDLVQLQLRWEKDTTLSTSGTQFHSVVVNCDVAGRSNQAVLNRTFKPGGGVVSVGVTAVRNSGSGTISMFGVATQINSLIVKGI